MAAKFSMHLRKITKQLEQQENIKTLFLNYSDMITAPVPQTTAINNFLGEELDTAKMIQTVDKNLYRNQS